MNKPTFNDKLAKIVTTIQLKLSKIKVFLSNGCDMIF